MTASPSKARFSSKVDPGRSEKVSTELESSHVSVLIWSYQRSAGVHCEGITIQYGTNKVLFVPAFPET